MDTEELTDDGEPGSMGDEVTYRDKAETNLDQIAHDAKAALAEHGIGIDLILNGKPARSKRDPTTHDGVSLPIRRSRSGQIASTLSLSSFWMPIGGAVPVPIDIEHRDLLRARLIGTA